MIEPNKQSLYSSEINKIFNLVKVDIENLKDKQPSEIDFKYIYEDLKRIIRVMIRKIFIYKDSTAFTYSLLAFSLELSKNVARGFWTELYEELDIKNERSHYYRLIFNILWNSLNSLGVETASITTKKGSTKRLLVGTLKMKIESDPTFFNDATQFFIDYYKKYKNEDIKYVFKTSKIYEKYKNKDKDEQFIAITRKLTEVVDYIIKNSLTDFEDEDKLQEHIKSQLGIDFKRYTRKHISTIIREVLNRYTPRQFIKILKNNSEELIKLPNGQIMNCSRLETKDFPYGIYNIYGEEYQVTPDIRISIEDINNWEFEKIGQFKNFSYYKKKEKFSVSKGIIKELFYNKEKFFLWYGTVPIGEEISIDGNYDKREGFAWNPNLRIKYPTKDKPMILALELGKISCFFAKNARKELKIEINEQHFTYTLDNKGFFSKKDLEFELDGINQDIMLKASLNGEIIKKKEFKLEESMLFSATSREQLKNYNENSNLTKRRFGEDKYYLFTLSPENIQIGNKYEKSILLKENGSLSLYKIYEVKWKSNDSFFLKNGTYEWKFERKRFIDWWFKNNENTFDSIKDIQIGVITNFNPKNSEEVPYIRIRDKDYYPIMENIVIEDYGKECVIYGEYLHENTLYKDLDPGEYILEIYFEDIINRKNFYIIPKVDIKWPNILLENSKSSVIISSEKKVLLNPKTNKCEDLIETPIYGHVYPIYKNKEKYLPIIYPNDVDIKVSFVIRDQYENDNLTFVIKRYVPPRKIYVFGFKLFDKKTLKPIHELNYYDIEKCLLLVYTIPFGSVELKINDNIIYKNTADKYGNCIFINLKAFKKYCKSSSTIFSISSIGISKKLEISWLPRIFSINSPESCSETNLIFNVDYEGPEDSQIFIKLEDEISVLNEIVINCNNCREFKEWNFNIAKKSDSSFLYLISYITSLNKKLLRSKSSYLVNELKRKISVDINGKLYQENLYNFLNKYMIPLAFLSLSDDTNNCYLKLPTISSQNEFIELLAYLNSEITFLIPHNYHKSEYQYLKEITKNDSCILFLNDSLSINELEKFLNPIETKKLIEYGIGVSSDELREPNNFLPKSPPLVIINGQELLENEKNKILNYCTYRTTIFIEIE